MRSRKQRYNQRDYKYQEQQRVPECILKDIYECQTIKSRRKKLYSSCCDYGDCDFCLSKRWDDWISKEGISEDWMSVDSADEHETTNNSLPSLAETSLDAVEESDWNTYHCKYVRKQMRISKCRNAAFLAYIHNPDIQKWINHTWCDYKRQQVVGSLFRDDEIPIIHTDGFFRKNRKAGYGVVMRTPSGVPLVGSAGVGQPVSRLYHELQGINRGLELAIKYGIRNKVSVYCSSYVAADLFASGFYCACDYENENDIVCRLCVRRCIPECSEEDFQLLMYPLILEIVGNSSMLGFTVYAIKRKQNRAADYLAKLQVKKEEIEPHEFPEELRAILYGDAQDGIARYIPFSDMVDFIGLTTHAFNESLYF